jgi:ferredoxin-NADP reductase
MYIAVAVLLLWFRVCTPLFAVLYHRMRVVEVRPEGPDAVSVYVTGRRLDELAAQSGQFFRWRFLTRGLWWAGNPYSLSAPPRPDLLRITVTVAGGHSAALRSVRPGTRVLAEGPYGAFTAERRRQSKTLLIAGGSGITPVRALFESMPGAAGDITLIYRASSPHDLLLQREIDVIAQHRGARAHYLVGRRRTGTADQLSARNLTRLVPDLRKHDVFVCGPPGFTDKVVSSLRGAGVPRQCIYRESFEF